MLKKYALKLICFSMASLAITASAIIFCKKLDANTLKEKWCSISLDVYLDLIQTLKEHPEKAYTRAQFYFDYNSLDLPGPYVSNQIVGGAADPSHKEPYKIIYKPGTFGEPLDKYYTFCTDINKAEYYYKKLSNDGSSYASNMLALINFNRGKAEEAIKYLLISTKQINIDTNFKGFYANFYQSNLAFSWFIVNSKNDNDNYYAGKNFVDSVKYSDLKNNTTTKYIFSMYNNYYMALEKIVKKYMYGDKETHKNYTLANKYLNYYNEACYIDVDGNHSICDYRLLIQQAYISIYGGYGVEKNYAQALFLFKKLPHEKLSRSERKEVDHAIGILYSYGGYGVEKSPVMAFQYFLKAAKEGDEKSQYNVGWAYLNGVGVIKDEAQAYAWLNVAKANLPDSANEIENLLNSMKGLFGATYSTPAAEALAKQYYSESTVTDN